MAITAISRDWGVDPSIVRITTTDDLTAITTTGYLTAQATNIELLQNGEFQWLDGDFVLIYYSDGEGFFVRDADNETFDAANPSSGLADTLQNGNIFVGNVSNIATGVAPSGDITLTNAGVFGIAAGAIVNADVNAAAAIAYSKLAVLPSANILVGNGASPSVATVRAVTGDIAITNTGVTSIAAGAIVNADVNASALIDFSKLAVLPSGNILVGNGAGTSIPASVAMSGDATIIASGALTIANNAVTSAKTAVNLIQYARVTMTAAEFNGMYGAPKLLVAAAGSNTLIVLHRAALDMLFVSAAYAAGGPVAIQWDSTVHGAGALASNSEAAADFAAGVSTSFQFSGAFGDTVGAVALSTTVNKGLYLSNTTGAFTTGDGTFVVHLWYSVAS